MSDETHRDGDDESVASKTRGRFVGIAILFPLIYFLSPGPVYWCLDKFGWWNACESTWFVVYAPLDWFAENVAVVERFYAWYERFFW